MSSNSFNIPLGHDLEVSDVVLIPKGEEEEFEVECPGSAATPAAEPGFACFYTQEVLVSDPFPAATVPSRQGVTFFFTGEGGAWGTWAVTAEE
jgi:hypothetical protein